ncbi:hypothetical protein D3C85_1222880 [compost metagenome]
MLAPRNLRDLRPATGGDQNGFGGKPLAVDLDRMRVQQLGMAFVQGHAAVDQQVAVDAIQAIDLAVLVGDQRRPVEVGLVQRPAKAPGLFEVFGKMRAVHQQLLGNAAHVDAGPPQITALGHGHFCTEARSKARRTYTTGTGANHIKVKIVSHFTLLGRPPAYLLPL